MKEATGELSMTVVTIVAVVAIMGIVTTVVMPLIKNYINGTWNNLTSETAYIELYESEKCNI